MYKILNTEHFIFFKNMKYFDSKINCIISEIKRTIF